MEEVNFVLNFLEINILHYVSNIGASYGDSGHCNSGHGGGG